MGLSDYINIITIAMAIIPLLKDLTNDTEKKRNILSRISKPAFLLFFLGSTSIILLHIDSSNKALEGEKQEKKIISDMGIQFNTSLKNYHLKYDTGTRSIINEEPPIKEKPILNFYQGPSFQNGNEDSISIAFSIKNFNNGIAKNISLNVISLTDINGTIRDCKINCVIYQNS